MPGKPAPPRIGWPNAAGECSVHGTTPADGRSHQPKAFAFCALAGGTEPKTLARYFALETLKIAAQLRSACGGIHRQSGSLILFAGDGTELVHGNGRGLTNRVEWPLRAGRKGREQGSHSEAQTS